MKKKMISGIKPSGNLTLGNYIGALKPFVLAQEDYEISVFIANLHCITEPIEPEVLKQTLHDALAFYLACGLDPKKTTIFLQSDVKEHAQLGFILSCITSMGELNRMTQFKDKKDKGLTLSSGFYTYPTLMSADILLHQCDFVPVGEDQKQHVELTRDLALRFNNRFGETFSVPEPLITEVGSRIMDLQDPQKKMSKSDTVSKGIIYLKDESKLIRKKIMSAITDSIGKVQFDKENQPGIANLLTIYAALESITVQEAQHRFAQASYGEFKKAVAECVVAHLEPIQARYHDVLESDLLKSVLADGAMRARQTATKTLADVQRKMGLDWIK